MKLEEEIKEILLASTIAVAAVLCIVSAFTHRDRSWSLPLYFVGFILGIYGARIAVAGYKRTK